MNRPRMVAILISTRSLLPYRTTSTELTTPTSDTEFLISPTSSTHDKGHDFFPLPT